MAGETNPQTGAAAPGSSLVNYLRSLWRGQFPLSRAFWTEMLVVGTIVNLVAMIASVIIFVTGAPVAVGVAVHLIPLPFNLLLFFAVWQAASRESSSWSFPAQALALVWFLAMFIV
jgi:hypothetical protein